MEYKVGTYPAGSFDGAQLEAELNQAAAHGYTINYIGVTPGGIVVVMQRPRKPKAEV